MTKNEPAGKRISSVTTTSTDSTRSSVTVKPPSTPSSFTAPRRGVNPPQLKTDEGPELTR